MSSPSDFNKYRPAADTIAGTECNVMTPKLIEGQADSPGFE